MKKISWLILILALGVWGCVSVDSTTVIDTDKDGYAGGQFRDVRNGKVADVSLFGGGAAATAASGGSALLAGIATTAGTALAGGAKNTSSSGGGGGMFGLHIRPGPSQGDPVPFAKSVAMINYSKRLKAIKYDEAGGIIEYEFAPGPMSMRSEYPAPKPAKLSSSFGHVPIE